MDPVSFLDVLKQFGPWVALAAFLLWRTVVVDDRMSKAQERSEKRESETTSALLRVLADNSRAMDRSARAIESIRPYLPTEARNPSESPTDKFQSPARHFTPSQGLRS